MDKCDYKFIKNASRVDAIKESILWLLTFLCYIESLENPVYGMLTIILVFIVLRDSYRQLVRKRELLFEGYISYQLALTYSLLLFFHTAILFALFQYIYLVYVDGGYLISRYTAILSSPESMEAFKQYNINTTALNEAVETLRTSSKLSIVFNFFTSNLTLGVVFSPIFAFFAKKPRTDRNRYIDIENFKNIFPFH